MDLDKVIKSRHSVRSFKKSKKVDYKKIIEIVEAGTKAPLAGNIYSMKYIIVSDKNKIKELAEASQQNFIADVDFIVVICTDKKFLEKSYLDRGSMYARQQAGASIENMLLKIVDLGFASCWIGAFSDETVKRILKIPQDIDVEAMLPIGIELGKSQSSTKVDLERALYFDEWNNKYMKPRKMTEGNNT